MDIRVLQQKYDKYYNKLELMNNKTGGVLLETTLTQELKEASFGHEYFYLKLNYPDWADMLHKTGNNMEVKLLENITTNKSNNTKIY